MSDTLSLSQAQILLESSFSPYGCRLIHSEQEYFGLEFFHPGTKDTLMVVFGMPIEAARKATSLGRLIAELHLDLAFNAEKTVPHEYSARL
ncbi:DUF1652 domain-containing protein [Pseudomonas duriflava]|uniref:DUF1652 domain-containing protein n=1 Tax=Pseudomonas duriflava TaxID=459528 RepID=UPI0013153071|nr:DUF1652 domain-containing protein [Pseudomonas duriflava]